MYIPTVKTPHDGPIVDSALNELEWKISQTAMVSTGKDRSDDSVLYRLIPQYSIMYEHPGAPVIVHIVSNKVRQIGRLIMK